MSSLDTVPNYAHVPAKLYATGLYELLTHAGQEAFVDACVATLNGIDSNFRHLKKRKDQTHIHRHGEDSVLYLLPNNRALAVDFIGEAGGSNPQPAWIVGTHEYTHADAHDPDDHGIGNVASVPQLPSYGELGDDAFFRAQVGVPLFADYAEADRAGHPDAKPNDGMAVWFSRPIYLLLKAFLESGGQPIDPHAIVRDVRNHGWRKQLQLPPV